jgi:uncharacterized protein YodC (DUF2158 family)
VALLGRVVETMAKVSGKKRNLMFSKKEILIEVPSDEGKVVMLKSGGHKMTVRVTTINGDTKRIEAFCVWHDENGNHCSHSYPWSCLAEVSFDGRIK